MITWDSVLTGLIVGVIAGIGQAIGTWFIMKLVLKRIDQQTEAVVKTVDEMHLTPAQKSEFASKLRSAGTHGINYAKDYGGVLKGALLWWKK